MKKITLDTTTARELIDSLTEQMLDGLDRTPGKSTREYLKDYRAQTQEEFEETRSTFCDHHADLLEKLLDADYAERANGPLLVAVTLPPRHAAVWRRAAKRHGKTIEALAKEWAVANIVAEIESGDEVEDGTGWVEQWGKAPAAKMRREEVAS